MASDSPAPAQPENHKPKPHGVHFDFPVEENVWSKISREVNVFGGGLLDGAAEKVNSRNLLASSPEIAESAGIGLLLAAAQSRAGWLRLGAEVVSLAFTASFAKDLSDKDRLAALHDTFVDTWKSPQNADRGREQVKKYAGDFAFDSALMMMSGGLGASYGKIHTSRANLLLETREKAGISEEPSRAGGNDEHAIKVRSGSEMPAMRSAGAYGASFQTHPVSEFLPPLTVFPDEPMPTSSRAARLLEDADKLPLKDIQKQEKLTWRLANGKTIEWEPSKESVEVRLQAQKFVDNFMAGRYMDALSAAVDTPVMEQAELNPKRRMHEVKMTPEELKKPEILAFKLDDLSSRAKFRWQKTVRGDEVIASDNDVVVPVPVIELRGGQTEVALVDFRRLDNGRYQAVFPEQTRQGRALTPEESKEMSALRSSPEGQRLLAETALFGFEEAIVHANQHLNMSGHIASPSFAEFARNFGREHGTRGHYLAFLGFLDSLSPHRDVLFEQEVPALAYDAGMPLPLVNHHFFFGARHVDVRKPVMTFLQAKEAGLVH